MTRHGAAALLATAVITLGGACHGERRSDEQARTPSVDQLAREGELTFADSPTVRALRSPKVAGRILYDPPEDLSLANALRTRPDLVKADTSRRDATLTPTRRDTTGGDATADTSGGAAKRKTP